MQIMDKYVQAGEALAWKENEVLDLTKQVLRSTPHDLKDFQTLSVDHTTWLRSVTNRFCWELLLGTYRDVSAIDTEFAEKHFSGHV